MIFGGSALRLFNILGPCKFAFSPLRNVSPLHARSAATKTLEERIGLPPKPKKPLTPYFRFMKQIRPKMVAEYPDAHISEIVKKIAVKWETVDEATKKKLQEEYKKDQIVYVEQRAKYDSQLSDDQKEDLKQMRHVIAEAKEKKVAKKKVKELGKPKRPASAFLRFMIKERTITPQDNLTYREWHARATEKWARLSQKEKDVFINETRKELEKYKQELHKWEEKMVRLGHIDVVRNEALIDPPQTKPRRKYKAHTEELEKEAAISSLNLNSTKGIERSDVERGTGDDHGKIDNKTDQNATNSKPSNQKRILEKIKSIFKIV